MVLDLLEFSRREAEAIKRAGKGSSTSTGVEDASDDVVDEPPEITMESTIAGMGEAAKLMGAPGRLNRMPPEVREAIRWAEEEKKKRGIK